MTVQLELWHLITLLLMFLGFCFAAGKLLVSQFERQIDVRFDAQAVRLAEIEKANKDDSSHWQRVERELMGLKAELPISYVRRDDYIRGQSVLEAKLDGLATKIENAQLRGLFARQGAAE
ncbi:hypothetical protein [Ideonella sp.]|uniref:hypothetical protein n=1 Tax=Ideonella sp. TaxID=1929293 RepID=UPI003BB4C19A